MHTPQQHKFGFKAWIPTIGLAFAAFVFNTSEFLPVGLLPNIAESIHESVSKTGLIITVYAWVVSLLSLPLTILTAKLERRRLLLWLIVIFALSHFVVLWADTFEKLIGARVCVAVTHSIFWSIMTPLAARVAPFGKQAFGLAAVMGGSIVATVLGVPIGTHLGQQVGWQGSFFIVGIAGIIGTVISSRTVDKHRSGTLVIPMLIMTVCVGLLTVTSSHFGALVILGTFWGASMTAISMAFQTLLLDTARDAADVATSMFSGIFNIGIGGGAFIGSRVSAEFGFATVPYVACALIGVCVLACAAIWLKRGSAILPTR